ncbi:MAG: plasmid stabilization protein [Acidobacteriota bacterium]
MSSLLIRQLDDTIKTRLRLRAARRGRSMEAEAREILKTALSQLSRAGTSLADRIHKRFAAVGGFELPKIPREPMRRPPVLDE